MLTQAGSLPCVWRHYYLSSSSLRVCVQGTVTVFEDAMAPWSQPAFLEPNTEPSM